MICLWPILPTARAFLTTCTCPGHQLVSRAVNVQQQEEPSEEQWPTCSLISTTTHGERVEYACAK